MPPRAPACCRAAGARLGAPAPAPPRRATRRSTSLVPGHRRRRPRSLPLAPTLEHLAVSHRAEQQGRNLRIPAGRIAPWLRFAAERVVGDLSLHLCVPQTVVVDSTPEVAGQEAVLELPVCQRVKRIDLHLQYAHTTWLRPQASGGLPLFAALTSLKIRGYACMEGSDLTALVRTHCPCLKDLDIFITLIVIFDVSIHSNSLRTVVLRVLETRRLEILAPSLEELTISIRPMEAQISAPKLVKVAWRDCYDPHLHRFIDVGGPRLQLLQTFSRASTLAKQFDEVDELDLSIHLKFPDVATYGCFLNETNKLPKCKSFCISLSWAHHALVPVMLHLLRNCNDTKKLRVHLSGPSSQREMLSCRPSCICRSEESRKIDGIDLSSLEVAEISGSFSGSHEQMELVEFLSSNARVLKRLLINDQFCRRPKKVREKVRSMCAPKVIIDFFVFREGRKVLDD